MKRVWILAVTPALIFVTGVAAAQSAIPWDGLYLGASLGGENTNVCNGAILTGMSIDPAAGFQEFAEHIPDLAAAMEPDSPGMTHDPDGGLRHRAGGRSLARTR